MAFHKKIVETKFEDKPWLKVEDIAKETGYCKKTITNFINRGELKAVKPGNGREYRIKHEWYNEWIGAVINE